MMRVGVLLGLIVVAACTHTEPFTTAANAVGPFGTGADQRLTLNPDQDYWPTWTEDGKGILYAYVDAAQPKHRCLGILPAIGGTRLWELCDNRSGRADSTTSYTGFALDSTGRLLAAEALTRIATITPLPVVNLWLADTARPYVRTALASLPLDIGGTTVTWLSQLSWIGPQDFLMLGQQISTAPHCNAPCSGEDSLFNGAGIVVHGTINGGSATFSAVTGTDSATSYSVAEGGSTIVFTRPHDLTVYQVPLSGGVPSPLPPVHTTPDTASQMRGELAGISCRGNRCIVARDSIFLTGTYIAPVTGLGLAPSTVFAHTLSVVNGLFEFTIGSNDTTLIASGAIYSAPAIAPFSGDVVVQVGGPWGWLQTAFTATSNLHLLTNTSLPP